MKNNNSGSGQLWSPGFSSRNDEISILQISEETEGSVAEQTGPMPPVARGHQLRPKVDCGQFLLFVS
ncbi:hypothetical protein VULLAG_LOCUS23901 [Vulpes lagopus]